MLRGALDCSQRNRMQVLCGGIRDRKQSQGAYSGGDVGILRHRVRLERAKSLCYEVSRCHAKEHLSAQRVAGSLQRF